MPLEVPASLKNAHDALHVALKRAMREPGDIGETARQIMQVMDGHMLREEKFALRPLGLLRELGRGATPPELAEAGRLTQGLKHEIAQMVNEHREIAELLRQLAMQAAAQLKPDYVELAEDMIVHAQMEEDVLYPAALLIGEYAARVSKD